MKKNTNGLSCILIEVMPVNFKLLNVQYGSPVFLVSLQLCTDDEKKSLKNAVRENHFDCFL